MTTVELKIYNDMEGKDGITYGTLIGKFPEIDGTLLISPLFLSTLNPHLQWHSWICLVPSLWLVRNDVFRSQKIRNPKTECMRHQEERRGRYSTEVNESSLVLILLISRYHPWHGPFRKWEHHILSRTKEHAEHCHIILDTSAHANWNWIDWIKHIPSSHPRIVPTIVELINWMNS